MSVMAVERKYAMVRISKGDYILPSNDAKQLWRIYSYEEDGTLERLQPDGSYRQVVGTLWACAKYERPFHNAGEWTDPDFLEWSNWLTWVTSLPTRKAAVDEALKAAARGER